MTPESRQKLKALLLQHEGLELHVYIDDTGNPTIGCGHKMANGISQSIALSILDEDIAYYYGKLLHFLPVFQKLNEARQIVLCDMTFNLGIQGLLRFVDMIAALEKGDHSAAAQAMLDSKWHEQVGDRCASLAEIMRKGVII